MRFPPASKEGTNRVASAWAPLLLRTRYLCRLPANLPFTIWEPERGTSRPLRQSGEKSRGARMNHRSVSWPISASKERRVESEVGGIMLKFGGQENRAALVAGVSAMPPAEARAADHVARRAGPLEELGRGEAGRDPRALRAGLGHSPVGGVRPGDARVREKLSGLGWGILGRSGSALPPS